MRRVSTLAVWTRGLAVIAKLGVEKWLDTQDGRALYGVQEGCTWILCENSSSLEATKRDSHSAFPFRGFSNIWSFNSISFQARSTSLELVLQTPVDTDHCTRLLFDFHLVLFCNCFWILL